MCGIVGCYNFRGRKSEEILLSMRDSLTHRGPDDAGIYFDEDNQVGIGHRRLSVIDLSSQGHQPMSDKDGSVWITYNGEIYNYKEIRKQLISRGYSFKSNSDTEVVLKAYLCWGIDCLKEFIGMFAIAIWDRRDKKLFIARDRAGVKPLYYYYKNNRLLFGSELKALMAHPEFPKEIDFGAVSNFLRYGYIPAPTTIFEDTFKLRPGHYFCIQNYKLREVKYWDINNYYCQEELPGTEDELAEELEDLLADSFKYRLLSDVPVGIFLSGGIDSSTLTAILQKSTNVRQKTFSIGFHEDKYNEAKWSSKVARHLETDHTEYYMSVKDCLGVVEELPEIYDEPFGDNSGIPTYILSKLARENVTVALSADGGDELFGGYKHYGTLSSLNCSFRRIPKFLRDKAVGTLNVLSPSRTEKYYSTLKPILPCIKDVKDKYEKYRDILRASNKGNFTDIYKSNNSKWTHDEMENLLNINSCCKYKTYFDTTFSELGKINDKSRMMATDFKTFLVDDILTKVDRASMRASLESREPFLDHRLVQYAARIPPGLKIKNGKSKYILRKILYKYVPRNLVDRPKMGFVVPLSDWLKSDLYPLLMDYLDENKLKREGIFNEKTVSLNIKSFLNGSVSENKIWYLLMFQMWKDRWL
ncbi:MAG: asparagine synthase (glutamine-hydrolyzing) [Thermodesulfobacteriota bacterium]